MSTQRWLLVGTVLIASVSRSLAGPCLHEIDRVQHAIDAKLDAKAGTGAFARESSAATEHREPTPESIAAAEARLGELSREKLAAISTAMTRAREADQAGDINACAQALADVQRALAQ